MFETSLVGYVVSCNLLPSHLTIAKEVKQYDRSEELTDDVIVNIMKLVDEKMNGIFTYYKTLGGIVILHREGASYCQLCDKIHSHNNAYVSLNGLMAEWRCYMAEGRIPLGEIDNPTVQIQDSSEQEELEDSAEDIPPPMDWVENMKQMGAVESKEVGISSFISSTLSKVNILTDIPRKLPSKSDKIFPLINSTLFAVLSKKDLKEKDDSSRWIHSGCEVGEEFVQYKPGQTQGKS